MKLNPMKNIAFKIAFGSDKRKIKYPFHRKCFYYKLNLSRSVIYSKMLK